MHLGHPRRRVAHERDDELRERGVERRVRPGEILGGSLLHLDVRKPTTKGDDERRRGIGGDRRRSAPGELHRQSASPGADVEDALSGRDAGKIGEDGRKRNREPAHEVVVGGLRDVEHRREYSH